MLLSGLLADVDGLISATEGDVEGVMDRPIGNTPEVHAECEKWYANRHWTLMAFVLVSIWSKDNWLTVLSDAGTPGTLSAASRAPKPSAVISQR